MRHLIRTLSLAWLLASSLAVAGCGGSGGGTVQPPKPDPTPAASGPVDEPPSSDGK